MMSYCKVVSRTPPEGLWKWAENADRRDEDNTGGLDTFGLVYEKVFVPDTTVDGMIGERTGKKIPVVRCTCSACGNTWDEGYAHTHAPDGATYGFLVEESGGMALAASGDSMICPCCGSPVSIRCKSKVGGDVYAGNAFVCSESYHMSAQLLPGQPGQKPLALIGWCMRRYCRKDGSDLHVILPYDAYVFDAQGCVKLTGHRKAYSGNAGYFTTFDRVWNQQKTWQETWGADQNIYGLTEELLEDSCMHNAKMLEYMTGGLHGSSKFPVPYLRMYQEHPNVENLVMQGATYLLDSLMAEQMRGYIWGKNVRGLMVLEDIDWEESRPSAMLGLSRDEFTRMKDNCWCPDLLRLYLACRNAGERLSDDDITNAFHLGEVEELTALAGQVSVIKTIRYLLRQIELDQERYLYDPEIDIYVDPEEFNNVSVVLLGDYWRMARNAGWDLDNPAVRWPKALEAAHDRAMEAEKVVLEKGYRKLFKQQYQRLKQYSFAWGGMLIRPCKTQAELTVEGEKLNHCVGGYAKSVAKGEKAIFFIRKETEPNKPWYTLELNEKELRVVQNRGKKNCERTEAVRKFEAVWLKWLQAGAPRDEHGAPIILPSNKKKEVRIA